MNTPARMDKYYRDSKAFNAKDFDSSEIDAIIKSSRMAMHEHHPYEIGANRMNPLSIYITNEYCKKYGIEIEKDIYSINSNGLRSEEFVSEHKGKHLLFAGCSVTVGEGIPLEYTWTKSLHEQISQEEDLSGYFNVAQSGSSSIFIIVQILKYIEKYGVPDCIFVMFPDSEREVGYGSAPELTQNLVRNLHQIMYDRVTSHGGRVISCSWDDRANEGYSGEEKILDTDARLSMQGFYKFEIVKQKHKYMFEFDDEYKKVGDWIENHIEFALDDGHPGIAEHDFYKNFFYNIYRNQKEDQ